MDKDVSCFSCKYYDGICCMKYCSCTAIFDEWESAKECGNYVKGDYNEQELERTDYE